MCHFPETKEKSLKWWYLLITTCQTEISTFFLFFFMNHLLLKGTKPTHTFTQARTHANTRCESEISDWISEKIFRPDPALLLLRQIVWTSCLLWCLNMFARICVFAGTTCAYGCGCWYFARLLATSANWARSSCLEQGARTSLLWPLFFLPHPSPPCAHTVSQEMT